MYLYLCTYISNVLCLFIPEVTPPKKKKKKLIVMAYYIKNYNVNSISLTKKSPLKLINEMSGFVIH